MSLNPHTLLPSLQTLFCTLLVSLTAHAHVTSTRNPGLQLEGESDLIHKRIVNHVEKCKRDSSEFLLLIGTVGKRTQDTGKVVRLSAYAITDKMIGHAGDLGVMLIDLSDLDVLPNPINNGKGRILKPSFDPIKGAPPWATTVCAWLGHEIAEMLEDVLAGKRDRPNHHYRIANGIEDAIITNYYGADRNRKEDCGRQHLDHHDILIQFEKQGIEILHQSRDRVNYVDGQADGVYPTGRLAYIEYVQNGAFPGRQKNSTVCNPVP